MKFNILIIDDEKNIREGLSASLEMEGYNTVLAENGKDGLELFAKGDIDLVITDLRMPQVTGEEVLEKIISGSPGIPVIVLTGHGSIDTAVEAMRKGGGSAVAYAWFIWEKGFKGDTVVRWFNWLNTYFP